MKYTISETLNTIEAALFGLKFQAQCIDKNPIEEEDMRKAIEDIKAIRLGLPCYAADLELPN